MRRWLGGGETKISWRSGVESRKEDCRAVTKENNQQENRDPNKRFDGKDKDNQGGCAADRPELFQAGDTVQACEAVAGCGGAGCRAGVGRLSLRRERSTRVF